MNFWAWLRLFGLDYIAAVRQTTGGPEGPTGAFGGPL